MAKVLRRVRAGDLSGFHDNLTVSHPCVPCRVRGRARRRASHRLPVTAPRAAGAWAGPSRP